MERLWRALATRWLAVWREKHETLLGIKVTKLHVSDNKLFGHRAKAYRKLEEPPRAKYLGLPEYHICRIKAIGELRNLETLDVSGTAIGDEPQVLRKTA